MIYHSNFGSDTICRVNIDHQNEVHTIKAYEDTALPANEGKTFLGWNTKADLSGDFLAFTDIGSGILLPEIQLDAQNEDNENHLYAVWGDIKIKKTGNKVYDNTGNYVDYTVVVTNAGNVAIASVALTDALIPNDVTLIPVESGVSDNILSPNETWTYKYQHVVTQEDRDAGQIDNTVTARATTIDNIQLKDVKDSVTIPLNQAPGLEVEKTADKALFTLGDKITYTVKVKNTGNVTLQNVTVVDTLTEDFADATIEKSLNDDELLDVGEIWTYTYFTSLLSQMLTVAGCTTKYW